MTTENNPPPEIRYQSAGASPLAWVVALLSFALFVALLWIAHGVLTGFHYARLQEQLRSTLGEMPIKRQIFNQLRFSDLVSRGNTPLRAAIEAADHLSRRNVKGALLKLAPSSFPAPLQKTVADTRALIERCQAELSTLNSLNDQWNTASTEVDAVLQEFAVLQSRLSALLNRTQPPTPELTEEDLVFYRDGFLAALPLLPGLADGLSEKDVRELVRPQARSFRQQELAAFGELRAQAQALAQRWTELERRTNELEPALDQAERSFDKLRDAALDSAVQLVAVISRPKLPNHVVTIYDTARRIAARAGFTMPELPRE